MKVLFITHCTVMAGANRSMLQLMLELRADYGVELYVLLPSENSQKRTLKDFLEEEHIVYNEVDIPYFKKEYNNSYIQVSYYSIFKNLKDVCKRLKPMHFDIVHSNSSVIDFGGYISREIGAKHVWHLRDFGDLDYGLYSIWGKRYEEATYKNGDAFIAISNAIKKYFEGIIDSSKIQVIYNGIKPKDNVPLAKHENDCVQFLCAGVLCAAKNQLEIIKAVDVLINKRNIDSLHLTIVGPDEGSYYNLLKDYISKHKIEKFITFTGELNGIEQFASMMDVGIMSSNCEAFGRVTVEYMLQNLAVIANDNGANEEIITDGKTGLIYEHDNVLALSDKMQKLIEDRLLMKQLAKAGREAALANFLSSKNTKFIYKLYAELLETPQVSAISMTKLQSAKIMLPKYLLSLNLYRTRRVASIAKSLFLGRITMKDIIRKL